MDTPRGPADDQQKRSAGQGGDPVRGAVGSGEAPLTDRVAIPEPPTSVGDGVAARESFLGSTVGRPHAPAHPGVADQGLSPRGRLFGRMRVPDPLSSIIGGEYGGQEPVRTVDAAGDQPDTKPALTLKEELAKIAALREIASGKNSVAEAMLKDELAKDLRNEHEARTITTLVALATDPPDAAAQQMATQELSLATERFEAELDEMVTARYIEQVYGISQADQQVLQHAVSTLGIIIDMRASNPDGMQWTDAGITHPKPEALKYMSVNQLDLLLGANKDNSGIVALFDPVLPPKPAGITTKLWQPLVQRYELRAREWHASAADRECWGNALANGTHANDRFSIDDTGAIYEVDANGRRRPVGRDHDAGVLRSLVDESVITDKGWYEACIEWLRAAGVVMHGATVQWKPPDERGRKLQAELLARWHDEGQLLVRFEPGQLPRPVPWPDPAEGGEGISPL